MSSTSVCWPRPVWNWWRGWVASTTRQTIAVTVTRMDHPPAAGRADSGGRGAVAPSARPFPGAEAGGVSALTMFLHRMLPAHVGGEWVAVSSPAEFACILHGLACR